MSEISIKSSSEIEKMREAGRLAAMVLEFIAPHVVPGVTTLELDNKMLDYIENTEHAVSACLGYKGYPRATCISPNEVVCHGIPGAHRLRDGDIVNIDVTVIKDGFHGDTSMMFTVGGKTTEIRRKVTECARKALYAGIKTVYGGSNLMDIGKAVDQVTRPYGFSIVREYTGHGIGRGFHEEPAVFHHINDQSLILIPGMTFTIEPMINAGTWKTKVNRHNGWTVTTKDGLPSAQWEHTILVTEDGCEVLTLRSDEDFPRILHNKA